MMILALGADSLARLMRSPGCDGPDLSWLLEGPTAPELVQPTPDPLHTPTRLLAAE